MSKLPVSVVIMTKNEEKNIGKCLESVKDFNQVIVVDSNSTDKTQFIVNKYGVESVSFTWNGQYPKKSNGVLRILILKMSGCYIWMQMKNLLKILLMKSSVRL